MGTQTKKYKICRRLGAGVYEKCQTQKFALSQAKRGKSDKRPKAPSAYGLQLIEKQKTRFSYGISERQLSNYVKEASKSRDVSPADKLYEILERRLDNVVYRLGIAGTRALARQIVAHGHIFVNGKRLKIPAYIVTANDVITIAPSSQKSPLFSNIETKVKSYTWPNWLQFDPQAVKATVTGVPKNTEGYMNLNTVLEFYSR